MTSSSYTSHLAVLNSGVVSDKTTYGNIIQSMLSKTFYNNFQGSLCGTTLDTVNKRFTINESGRYLFTYTGGVVAGGGSPGNLAFTVFINNNQYSYYVNDTTFATWCTTATNSFTNLSSGTGTLTYFTLTLNPGDFIDIRAKQNIASSATVYYITNGTTITLEKIE